MIEIRKVKVIEDHRVQLTLTNGDVVERDLDALLWGPVFEPIRSDQTLFRRVRVEDGVLTWPGDVDLSPETVLWNGPTPRDPNARPLRFLAPRSPSLQPARPDYKPPADPPHT